MTEEEIIRSHLRMPIPDALDRHVDEQREEVGQRHHDERETIEETYRDTRMALRLIEEIIGFSPSFIVIPCNKKKQPFYQLLFPLHIFSCTVDLAGLYRSLGINFVQSHKFLALCNTLLLQQTLKEEDNAE